MTTTIGTSPQAAARPPDDRAPELPVGHTTGWWGMVLLTATESMMFGVFLASYFYLRFTTPGSWPPAGDKMPSLFWPSVGTSTLIISALPYWLGRRAAAAGHAALAGLALFIAWLLGCGFVLFQFFDWIGEYPQSTLSKDAYGSLFFTIPGLHVAHLVAGLIMVGVLVARSLVTGIAGEAKLKAMPIKVIGIYWYFLVIVAVAIYVVVYLSPYL